MRRSTARKFVMSTLVSERTRKELPEKEREEYKKRAEASKLQYEKDIAAWRARQ